MLPEHSAVTVNQPASIDDLNAMANAANTMSFDVDNDSRTGVAAAAVLLLATHTGLTDGNELAETAITDLLANLMHLCSLCYPAGCGTSFDSMIETARMHFSFESDMSAEQQ